jgi:integrase
MRDSDLLFPSETSGFRAASALDKRFREVGKGIGLKKRITPRAMRPTFQDLARNADIETIVRQKICGHARQAMSNFYSTVPQREFRRLSGRSFRSRSTASFYGTVHRGGKDPKNKNGQVGSDSQLADSA